MLPHFQITSSRKTVTVFDFLLMLILGVSKQLETLEIRLEFLFRSSKLTFAFTEQPVEVQFCRVAT